MGRAHSRTVYGLVVVVLQRRPVIWRGRCTKQLVIWRGRCTDQPVISRELDQLQLEPLVEQYDAARRAQPRHRLEHR